MRLLDGGTTWSGVRDSDGHRTYRIKFLAEAESPGEGPAAALACPGLPLVGSAWLVDDDQDLWAWFRPDAEANPRQKREGEATQYWEIDMLASTRPPERGRERCHDIGVEDPLLEPPKISGSFVKEREEATHDMLGRPITYSSHEQIRGPQVEFDAGYDTVRIEQNVPLLQLELLSSPSFKNGVNDQPLWGMPARTVKLSGYSWDRRFHGQCSLYYTRVLDFEVRGEGWDRSVVDESDKVLNGHWGVDPDTDKLGWILDDVTPGEAPDRDNPAHFIRAVDHPAGNPCRLLLNGAGVPYIPPTPAGTGEVDFTSASTCEDSGDGPTLALNKTYVKTSAGIPLALPVAGLPIAGRFPWVAEGRLTLRILSGDPNHITIILYNAACEVLGVAANSTFAQRRAGNVVTGTFTADPEGNTSHLTFRVLYAVDLEPADLPAEAAVFTVKVEGPDEEDAGPGQVFIQKYPNANLLLLGIPTEF